VTVNEPERARTHISLIMECAEAARDRLDNGDFGSVRALLREIEQHIAEAREYA
jgi:hypothetical protein